MSANGAAAILAGLQALVEPGTVVELRVPKAGRVRVISGYFDDLEAMTADAEKLSGRYPGIYFTANPVKPGLLARAANRVVEYADPTTSDPDVLSRRWLPIDLDPVRPSAISATDEEHEAAIQRARDIQRYLLGLGWPKAVAVDSGNGCYLLPRIDLPNDEASRRLVEQVLKALAFRFDDQVVHVDQTMFNAARIIRIPGTLNRKGDSTDARPHREARLLHVPDSIEVVPVESLAALAATLPQDEVESRNGHRTYAGGDFDLERFVGEHLDVAHHGPWQGTGYRWILRTSPLCDHDGDGPYVLRCTGGGIKAGCHHDSCRWTWGDLRERYEPRPDERPRARAAGSGAAAVKPPDRPAEGRKISQSTRLVQMALASYRFGLSSTGEPFAVLVDGPNVALVLRGKGSLRAQLARAYSEEEGRAPSQQALADALLVLEGEALRAPKETLHLRVARHGEAIVIDLGDDAGRCAVIGAGGWRVADRSPVLFQRTALTRALPVPVAGGDLLELRQLLNVADDSWPLVVGWLLAAFLPDIPHPVLLLMGEQGSGKSAAGRTLSALIDPTAAPTRAAPRDLDTWAVAAAGSWTVVLDNLSRIPEWLSDALCRVSTGEGLVKRLLYSDLDLVVLSFRRVVALTAIEVGSVRGDLGDRLLAVELDIISPEGRRLERDLQAAFDTMHPRVLGGLLDLLALVLAELPLTKLDQLPRMADFALMLAALDRVWGSAALSTYLGQHEQVARDVVEGDLVARRVADHVHRLGAWSGTAQELHEQLTPDPAPDRWPSTAHHLAGRLKRAAPSLRQIGIGVDFVREGKNRTRVIRLLADAGGRLADAKSRVADAKADAKLNLADAADAHLRSPSLVLDSLPKKGGEQGGRGEGERVRKSASAASAASAVRIQQYPSGWYVVGTDGCAAVNDRGEDPGSFSTEDAARTWAQVHDLEVVDT